MENLHTFFRNQCGIKPKHLAQKEADMLIEVELIMADGDDQIIDDTMVNGIICSLCKWPPLFHNNPSGNALMDAIPDEVCQEFLPILFAYLDHKFPGIYRYEGDEITLLTSPPEEL